MLLWFPAGPHQTYLSRHYKSSQKQFLFKTSADGELQRTSEIYIIFDALLYRGVLTIGMRWITDYT